MPTAMDGNSRPNWPTKSVPPMAISVGQETGGLGRMNTGSAAKHEAQGGEQERRKVGQRQPDEDEVQPPDEGERDGEDDMAGLQGKSTGWEGQPLCTRTARLNRAAGPRPVRSARPAAPRHKKSARS